MWIRKVRGLAAGPARVVSAAFLTLALSRAGGAQASVTLLDYRTSVPATWMPRPPSSSSRLAEFVVPPLKGAPAAEGAEVVVYFFGKTQGGNVQANLTRWRSQFSTPDGSPVPEKVTSDSTGGFPITFAEFRGTYRRGIGAGSADSVRTGQALIAAIAETPRGTMFIQLFGPAARVASERDTFMRFVKGFKESSTPPAGS
jgi:hypothetical protein